MNTEFQLEWQKSKDKELTWLLWNKFNVLDFSTERFFFLTFHAPITWFKLSRVKLYRNDLKGNKNYLELAGGYPARRLCSRRVVSLIVSSDTSGRKPSVNKSCFFKWKRIRVDRDLIIRWCGTAQFTVTSASYHLTHFEFPSFHVYYWLPDFYCRSLNLVEARKRKNQGPGPRVPKMPVRTENKFCNVHIPESFGSFSMESRNKSQIIGEEEFFAISCGSNHKMTGLHDDLSDTTNTKLRLIYFSEKKKRGYVISQRSLFLLLWY